MLKNKTMTVNGIDIGVTTINDNDYISLTDIVRTEESNDHIRNWMRNKNTVEFLGLWETLNNPHFKAVEFDRFKNEAGSNAFNLRPKRWIEATNAIGIVSKSGRYGGTYAHKDIAFEFAAWLSPAIKLYIIREFQRLKESESHEHSLEWQFKRTLSKINYKLHSDAIKNYVIPSSHRAKDKQWIEYANEADILNVSVFGYTAKQWSEANPEAVLRKESVRDTASINELVVLSNMESLNSIYIKQGMPKHERLDNLRREAKEQLEKLNVSNTNKAYKKLPNTNYLDSKPDSNFNESLKQALDYSPKD